LKLLVPDRMAGVIIGKGGSGIAELEQETGSNMRLSGNRIYFPGTSERVMVCGGDQVSIDKMIAILVSKLNDPESPQFSIRLVLTNSACSAIIGKGGEVIKSISQQFGSTIRASDRIENPAHERIVDVKGPTSSCVISTVHEIVMRIQEDISFRESASILNYYQPQIVMPPESSYYYPNTPSGLAAAAAAAGAQSAGLGRPGGPTAVGISALVDQYPITIDFTVPSGAVGAIIGKNGEARNRIVHSTGANVVVSERTTDSVADRKISISGPLAAVQAALTLVAKLVVESQ
jgi:heterogeneous nuclear rnp K-like protein 2